LEIKVNDNLHYKYVVAKLGTAATGNFLSGKRKKVETPLLSLKKGGVGSWGGSRGGGGGGGRQWKAGGGGANQNAPHW
jgi:hypothetical protein